MIVHKRKRDHTKYIVGQGIGFQDVAEFIANNKDNISNIAKLTSEIANAGIQSARLVKEIKQARNAVKNKANTSHKDLLKQINEKFGEGFRKIN